MGNERYLDRAESWLEDNGIGNEAYRNELSSLLYRVRLEALHEVRGWFTPAPESRFKSRAADWLEEYEIGGREPELAKLLEEVRLEALIDAFDKIDDTDLEDDELRAQDWDDEEEMNLGEASVKLVAKLIRTIRIEERRRTLKQMVGIR